MTSKKSILFYTLLIIPLIILLILILVVFAEKKKNFQSEDIIVSAEEHLKTAEELHSMLVKADGTIELEKLAKAIDHYNYASETNNVRIAAKAYIGKGQLKLLAGDTEAAIYEWKNAVEIIPEDFEALRAMKSIADILYEDRKTEEAKKWYNRIVNEFGDKEAAQAIKIIIDAAKNRLNSN